MAAARINVPTVFVSGGGLNRKYGGNTDISLAIKENGVYDFTFADAAGNMTQQQITVDSIDEIPPVVYASGIPETYIRSEDCSVKVTMSEAGTITFRGKEYPVKAPTDKNGDGELKGDELDTSDHDKRKLSGQSNRSGRTGFLPCTGDPVSG